ncbi:PaaI family thioesterase, partial [Pseudomonas syringae group genomosp. 7]|uniref:PaaI family thioesterase n=1 Tax=Pseudomonas syringae group genomosp. 7 TaxID=251699 RepID=UPI00376F6D65
MPDDLTHTAYFKILGSELSRLDDRPAEVPLPLEDHLLNPGNVMHGGAIFSLVVYDMGLARSSAPGVDQRSVTLEGKINYERGLSDGEGL